jgi:hypothetical protein
LSLSKKFVSADPAPKNEDAPEDDDEDEVAAADPLKLSNPEVALAWATKDMTPNGVSTRSSS